MHHELRFFANTWKDSYWPAALFFMDLLNNLIYVLYIYKVYLFILQVKKKEYVSQTASRPRTTCIFLDED